MSIQQGTPWHPLAILDAPWRAAVRPLYFTVGALYQSYSPQSGNAAWLSVIPGLVDGLPLPVLDHIVEVDGLAVGQHELVVLVVDIAALLVVDLLLAGRRGRAGDATLIRVLAPVAVRVDVAVLAAHHAVHADRLLLEAAVVVLIAPSDAAIRVVLAVTSQDLRLK